MRMSRIIYRAVLPKKKQGPGTDQGLTFCQICIADYSRRELGSERFFGDLRLR